MDNIKRHLSYILITAMTAAFVIESFSSAGGSFAYAGTGSGLPKVLKKPVRVLYVKYNVKNGRITSATHYSFTDATKKAKVHGYLTKSSYLNMIKRR